MSDEKSQTRAERRAARWEGAASIDELSPRGRLALRMLDGVEDALLVAHLAVLVCVGLWHLVQPTGGFTFFVDAYQTLIRDYWLIASMESGEYGMWPGILTAFGQDLIFTAVVMLPLMIPVTLIRRRILRDPRSAGDTLLAYLGETLGFLLMVYVVGAIVGTFAVLVLAGMAGSYWSSIGFDFESSRSFFAPVTSGLLLTDLTVATAFWWDERASSPRSAPVRLLTGIGALAGIGAFFAVEATVDVEVHFEHEGATPSMAVMSAFVSQEAYDVAILYELAGPFDAGEVEVADLATDLDVEAPSKRRLYPLAPESEGTFYRSLVAPFAHRPTELWREGNTVHATYGLSAVKVEAPASHGDVTLKRQGKGDFATFWWEVPEPDQVPIEAPFRVDVTLGDTPADLLVGAAASSDDGQLAVLRDGDEVLVMSHSGGQPDELTRLDASPNTIGLLLHPDGHLTILLDDTPRLVAQSIVVTKLGAAMVRLPSLEAGDEAKVKLRLHGAPQGP